MKVGHRINQERDEQILRSLRKTENANFKTDSLRDEIPEFN